MNKSEEESATSISTPNAITIKPDITQEHSKTPMEIQGPNTIQQQKK